MNFQSSKNNPIFFRLLSVFVCLFLYSSTFSQIPLIDSLKTRVQNHPENDTTKVNLLIALCKAYTIGKNDKENIQQLVPELFKLSEQLKYDKGIAYAHVYMGLIATGKSNYKESLDDYENALRLMNKINDKNGEATCYIYIGNSKNYLGKFAEAIAYKLKAIKIKEELGDKYGMASAYNSIGVSYREIGKTREAFNYSFKALKLREAINDRQGISATYLNIGVLMYDQGYVSKSIDYLQKSLKIKEELGDKEGAAMIYSNISSIFIEQKKYKEALEHNLKSINIAEEIEDKQLINSGYLNIARIFFEQKKFDLAISYFQKVVKVSKELGDMVRAIEAYNYLGNCFEGLKRYEEAADEYLKALAIAQETNYKTELPNIYTNLASVSEKTHNYKQSLFYTRLHTIIKDSLLNEASLKHATELNTRYETEKKEKEILLLTKDQQLKDKTLKEQRLIRIGLIIGLGLLLGFSFLLFNRYRYKQKANLLLEKQKAEIHQKNTQITDSIDYAKTIQDAILPDDEKLKMLLPEHFIFYQPKAIVSGDFYWVGKKEDELICAVADCTGHGVPGAFMSLLGHNILENIIQRHDCTNPGSILTALNKEIVARFSKGTNLENVKHAMDIAIISIDKTNRKLQYAGAGNSIYIVRDNKLTEIKADKHSTGIVVNGNNDVVYANNHWDLLKNDMIYLFSDGFPDQKGGTDKKKFFYPPFKELLARLSTLAVKEQHEQLKEVITRWQGDGEQIDDMLVMGIRICT